MSIENEIEKVENKIVDLRLKTAVQEGVLRHLKAIQKAIQSPNQPPVNTKGRRKLYKDSIPSHLKSVLKKANRPMKIAEMVEALKKRGVSTNAKHGLKTSIASTLFKRKDIFSRIGHGTYSLASERKEIVQTE